MTDHHLDLKQKYGGLYWREEKKRFPHASVVKTEHDAAAATTQHLKNLQPYSYSADFSACAVYHKKINDKIIYDWLQKPQKQNQIFFPKPNSICVICLFQSRFSFTLIF